MVEGKQFERFPLLVEHVVLVGEETLELGLGGCFRTVVALDVGFGERGVGSGGGCA
jgi:hypothetical protein